jgi:hypothetical protein
MANASAKNDPMMNMDHSHMAMDSAEMNHSGMDHSAMDHSGMDHSTMAMSDDPADPPAEHHHHMTPSMLLVEHEHFWFMIVGLGVAFFKLVCDAGFWRRRFVPYAWPGGMMLLGILLVLYRE